ncbi:helix-hairpin-helix domain-containing protein [Sphingobacterium sp. lm-10]|uniref:DNA polymerase/3'-5' exonuclease PolX n=1 Tax=Sphingobacterium sp. lm-10 TaxID=2944904 RepID=UPI0020206144|nr:DNA polymerase/3'-5' exonuclease PolX [Sphingobacterium sp. lm-10]MCL7986419.1 helix-hairpin-helix domain-containing protein [Sphingobacterium sp. lm-10]
MDNKSVAKVFKLYGQLMELMNENPFRTKAITGAAFKIDKLPFAAEKASMEELSQQPGIGNSTAEKIKLIIQSGTLPELDKLMEKVPEGVLEMLHIKGLGPKKIQIIWKSLNIESIGELYYACNENRLVEAKGFGLKTQEEIKKNIEFAIANKGWVLYARATHFAEATYEALQQNFPDNQVVFTGDYRRKTEVLQYIDFLIDLPQHVLVSTLESKDYVLQVDADREGVHFKDDNNIAYRIFTSSSEAYAKNWLLTTGSGEHIDLLTARNKNLPDLPTEAAIYESMGLTFIEPELREGFNEIDLAAANNLPKLIRNEDILGTLHNHSTYSDGVHSLEQMATYCKEQMGLQYLGICDHSKTAVYANGLSIERIEQQWKEVEKLNQKLAPFKIFKGIESDILGDGSLDYPTEILSQFDFVVASVHSNLGMTEEKATERLIKAIENPYTTILGHPTGRLLLSRAGYPIDYRKVIDACASNQVVIEINANPLRLDLDWRWHRYALQKGVLLSINPDAHRMEGFHDMQYGVLVGRKGGLSADKCLNAFNLEAIQEFFDKRKAEKS